MSSSRALVVWAPSRPNGRPPRKATPALTEAIVDLLLEGNTVRAIGKMPGMPSVATMRRWIVHDEDFRRAYGRAKEGLCEDKLEEILEFAADSSADIELVGGEQGGPLVAKVNKEAIARSQMKIDTNLVFIAKIAPRKYGEPEMLELPQQPAAEGADAKVIQGERIRLEDHPLYESILAWGRVAEEK